VVLPAHKSWKNLADGAGSRLVLALRITLSMSNSYVEHVASRVAFSVPNSDVQHSFACCFLNVE